MIAGIVADGFAVAERVVAAEEVDAFVVAMDASPAPLAGVRQAHLSFSEIRKLVASPAMRDLVEPILGTNARVVRSIFFDKTPQKNWGVPWHQDLTIAVEERREVAGFVGWSLKEGIHHVQAPREVLEEMLTVRLHLDDCGPENGPLRVLPGTHRNGWLDSDAIEEFKGKVPEHACIAPRGAAVLMRPLLLHASSRATKPGHRRVLHLEFSARDLPGGLRFYSR